VDNRRDMLACSGCSAPGFLDFELYRFAECLKGRIDLVEARGVAESEQTIDRFSMQLPEFLCALVHSSV
jgi:hypothetical protein